MTNERAVPASSAHSRLVQVRRESLRRSGVTQAELAIRAGVSRQSIGLVLAGHHRSRHVEEAIADACGLSRAEMFGGPLSVASARTGTVASTDVRPARPSPREVARGETTQPVEHVEGAAMELERRATAQLRALAEEIFLAMAGQGLAAERPVVRAAAAALRELGPATVPRVGA